MREQKGTDKGTTGISPNKVQVGLAVSRKTLSPLNVRESANSWPPHLREYPSPGEQ